LFASSASRQSETVKIDYPVDLRLVAECVDTSVATMQELNPSLLRLTTPKDQTFDLHIPAGTKEKYQQAIALIPSDMRVWWHYHRVRSGDTLGSIAKKYHTTTEAIQKVNGLEGDDLRLESKLIIPLAPGRQSSTESTSSTKRPTTRYKIRKGDTILSVADRLNVSPENLRKWNHVKGNALKAGRTLTVYRGTDTGDTKETASRSRKNVKAETEEREEETKVSKSGRGHMERTASRSGRKSKAEKAEPEEETTTASKSKRGSKASRNKKKASEAEEEAPSASKSSRQGKARKADSRSTKSKKSEEAADTRKSRRGEKSEEADSEASTRKGRHGSKVKAARAKDEEDASPSKSRHPAKSSRSAKKADASGGEAAHHTRRTAR
jgi:membrane-bound lytic murein transglycosylase D